MSENYPDMNGQSFRLIGDLISTPHIQDLSVLLLLFIRMSRFVTAKRLNYQVGGQIFNSLPFAVTFFWRDHQGIEFSTPIRIFSRNLILTALKHVLSHAAVQYRFVFLALFSDLTSQICSETSPSRSIRKVYHVGYAGFPPER